MRQIVDSHFHLYPPGRAYAAGSGSGVESEAFMKRDFLWPDLEDAVAGTGVAEAVFVHIRSGAESFAEAEFVETLAGRMPEVRAFVGWAPLESPEVELHLDALGRFRLLCGVRRIFQYEADDRFCARPTFVAGARLAAARGLLLDLCPQEHQLLGVVELATAVPEATIVLEHMGKPRIDRSPSEQWRQGIHELGACPNVWCKLSPTFYAGELAPLDPELARRYVELVLEAFGFERSLFGSNWPVSTGLIGYRAWVELLEETLAGTDDADTSRFFADNARALFVPAGA